MAIIFSKIVRNTNSGCFEIATVEKEIQKFFYQSSSIEAMEK